MPALSHPTPITQRSDRKRHGGTARASEKDSFSDRQADAESKHATAVTKISALSPGGDAHNVRVMEGLRGCSVGLVFLVHYGSAHASIEREEILVATPPCLPAATTTSTTAKTPAMPGNEIP